jgi:nucleoside-diphosphate-sugar epimerase
MPHALIAGCGDVGTRAGLLLAAAGWTVTGLRRGGTLLAPLAVVHADLTRRETLAGLPAADLVLYLPTPGARTEAAYRAVFIDGPAALLAALPRPPARLVFVSSTAVYGDFDGGWADEDSPAQPEGFNGVVLLEAERLLAAGPVPTVVARLAGIYGPGREWMLARVRAGEACRPGAWTNRIHAQDAARMLVHLATLPDPYPVYVGVDDAPATECEVMGWLAGRMGLPAPPPATDARSPGRGMAAGNRRLSNRRLRDSGFRFDYPDYRAGYTGLTPDGRESD